MHKLVAALAVSFCLVLGFALPASAAVVIFHSKTDNTYGWCANGSYTYCEQAADEACVNSGGKECRHVLECSGGWGAMAFSKTVFSGFGASCHTQDASTARYTALVACIAASNSLCDTASTFSTSARETSKGANLAYDQAFYAQILLNRAGFFSDIVDGEMGSKTRAAVRQFQSALGLSPTGVVDASLLELMTYAAQGEQPAIDLILDHAKLDADDIARYGFGEATAAAPRLSFSAQLATLPDEKRRLALATTIAVLDKPCTLPAIKAEALSAEDGAWNVDCAEGPYFVILTDAARIVTLGHGTVTTTPTQPVSPKPPLSQPTSPAGIGAPSWSVPSRPGGSPEARARGGRAG